jgi:hypothetical protein
MKKQIVAFALILVISASAAMATGVPAGWGSSPYYTYQQWNFSTQSSNNTYSADAGYTSPGTPSLTVRSDVAWNAGTLKLNGPATSNPGVDPMMVVSIPNTYDSQYHKDIWVDVVFQTNDYDLMSKFYIAVFDNNGIQATMALPDPLVNLGNNFFELSTTFAFDHQPASETMLFGVTQLGADKYLALDSMTIATRCIPEPATLALLACGGLAFIRRQRQ